VGFNLIGRLNDGVTVTQAAQDADRAAEQASRNFPANMAAIRITGDAALLKERAVATSDHFYARCLRPLRRALIACINVASFCWCAPSADGVNMLSACIGAARALIRESFF